MKKLFFTATTAALVSILFAGLFGSAAFAQSSSAKFLDSYGKIENVSDDTILGADMSYYQIQKTWDKSWLDLQSRSKSPVAIMKEMGVNTVSVKIAVNPTGDNAYMSLDYAIATIKEANAAGLKTNAVFMFADWETWKDAQNIPSAWTGDATEEAASYLGNCLTTMKGQNALPTIVTLGKDINWNFLGYSGDDSWKGWKALGDLSQVVKSASSEIKVSIGIAQPDAADGIKWVLEKLDQDWIKLDYDYVAVSVYPTGNQPDSSLDSYIETMVSTFDSNEDGKSIYVQKAAFLRTTEAEEDNNVEKQAEGAYGLLKASVSSENAGGIVYDRACIAADWNNLSFFDEYGRVVPSAAIFAKASGKAVDLTIKRDPYQYGDETGLKNEQVVIEKIKGMTNNTVRGVDASSYIALQNAGVTFKNYAGETQDLMQILAENGVNYVRIRIWADPYDADGKPYGGGICDLPTALEIGKAAAKYDVKVMLCLQYSDFWTDPAQQHVPKAWAADVNDYDKMRQHVADYTEEVITAFQAIDGIDIGQVQVGNEITNGFLGYWADRDHGGSFTAIWGDETVSKRINSYLNAGCKTVRKLLPNAQIVLQLETPNVSKYDTIMSTWKRDGVDYDVLGSSYYPFWSVKAKANTPATLTKVMELAASYNKLFVVCETAWCSTTEDADGTPNSIGAASTVGAYKIGAQGQVDMLTDLYTTIAANANALGAFYWEPAWIPVKAGWRHWESNKKAADELGTGWAGSACKGYLEDNKYYYNGKEAWGGSSWDNNAMFDFNGNALQSLKFYKEAVSDAPIQKTVINIVDSEDNIIGTVFVDVELDGSKVVKLPTIKGFTAPAASTLVFGSKEGIKTVKVRYQEKLMATLSTTTYSYNGKVKKPVVTVTYGNKTIAKGIKASTEDVTLTYASGRKNVGTYKVTVTGIGKYADAGSITLYFKINPKATYVKKLNKGSKSIKVTWAKRTTQVTGIQIRYSTSSAMKSAKTVTVKGTSKSSRTISKLKGKKKYYVQVRTYKTVNGKKYYSAWSAKKTVTTKK